MCFLVDAQLPPSLAEALRVQGHDAIHAVDLDLLAASDTIVWDQAIAHSAALMTKDRDFTLLRAARRRGRAIVWIRLGNMGNRMLIATIMNALPKIVSAIERGDTIVELTN